MTRKKYLLCPGWVTSQTDGQHHFISASRLARLYNVRMDECEVFEPDARPLAKHAGLIRLTPRFDGQYKDPHAESL